MRLMIILMTILFVTPAAAESFSFKTTYWFNKIEASCTDGECNVDVNGKFQGMYKYTMDGPLAKATVKGVNIEYNTITKELKF